MSRTPAVAVAGAGLFGLTVARELADAGVRVELFDRRGTLGGNAWSSVDRLTGIEVHRFGAHIFHTSNARVWEWANRFGSFYPYRHRVVSEVPGVGRVPMPFSRASVEALLGREVSPEELPALMTTSRVEPGHENDNLETRGRFLAGDLLYESLIEGYTAKQWGRSPKELPARIINRIPVSAERQLDYFTDTWQGLPSDGYAAWLTRMADHPLITVHTRTEVGLEVLDSFDALAYSGPVDELFGCRFGSLDWRSVRFELRHRRVDDDQGAAVVNYASLDEPATRQIEFKHFRPDRSESGQHRQGITVVAKEYPSEYRPGIDEPYYPVGSPEDRERLQLYRDECATYPRLFCGGRLGSYQYLDMHMAIGQGLSTAARIRDAL